ncbi:MAG: Xaa-Pro peptidase family protein [Lentisphaeria bacterium]|nr:Xaa-Pro peptidase family protein [Lentisphaeria bacterium]
MLDHCQIPLEEFQRRIQLTQEAMRGEELDLLLAFSTESEPAYVRYYSDYWPSFETAAVLIPAQGEPVLLIGPESLNFGKARSKIDKVVQLMDFRESSQPDYPGSKLPTWQEIMDEYKPKRLGIAGWHMFPHTIMEDLRQAVKNCDILNADAVVRGVCMQKSENELDCLRQAAKISELGFQAVLENIRPGMTEVQLAGLATAAMLANGAEATGYPVWCCSGPNSIQAISRPTLRKVRRGEIIHFSVGAKVAGYSASIGRPVVLGKCPEETRKFMQVGLDAMLITIDNMRAGTAAADVAKKTHGYIREQGYGHTILYGPAHGCGQMECEFPFLETSSQYELKQNMVFMVDVFLAEKDMGFRWEDGVIVREGAAEELSSYKRQLNILEV